MAGSSRPSSLLGLRRLFRTKHCRVAGDVFDVRQVQRLGHAGILHTTVGQFPLLWSFVSLCSLWSTVAHCGTF